MRIITASTITGVGLVGGTAPSFDGENVYVMANVVVANGGIDASGIVGGSNRHSVVVDGMVVGTLAGVLLGTSSVFGSAVQVGRTGSVYGLTDVGGGASYGIAINGYNSTIINHGAVYGDTFGISLGAIAITTGTLSRIANDGMIDSAGAGINHAGTDGLLVINSGTIRGGLGGVAFQSTGDAYDSIRNSGFIDGQVRLGAGNDIYDGRGGSVAGWVLGEGDNDLFIPGISAESLDGGTGNFDTLDFTRGGGVTVALDNSVAGTRTAQDDVYSGFEVLLGSMVGNDRLTGSTANDRIEGNGGTDFLSGGNGDDTLVGGSGIDQLRGGLGIDNFRFNLVSDCGDTIQDYGSAFGNDDTIWISASGFGSGLTIGTLAPGSALFVSGAGHVAGTTAVRFLFDTTDKSLWFDADGSGATAAILVADLQQNAVFVASDISII